MKAIRVTHFAVDGNLALATDAPTPALGEPTKGSPAQLLVKVLACGLNPADCKLMDGSVSLVMKPKQFPYVPGLDVCGVVEQISGESSSFKVGDRVIAALPPMKIGGLAEFVAIDSSLAALAPPADLFSPIDAASLPTAGCTALQAVKDAGVELGSRVVVIGASGGVGSLAVQLAKVAGASFVAATSTNHDLVTSLGADQVVDYRASKWWEAVDPQSVDAVIDCVGCEDSWNHCGAALRRGGRYVAVADSPESEIRNPWQLLAFAFRIARRALSPFSPSYSLVSCFPKGEDLQELVAAMATPSSTDSSGRTKLQPRAVLDPSTPVAFSLEGVGEALRLQRSHRARGKLVVAVQ